MDELFIKLKKEIYEELDVSLDISDDYLYEIIDECIYKATAVKRLSLNQREMLRTRLYNSIKKLDVLQELIEDDEITERYKTAGWVKSQYGITANSDRWPDNNYKKIL